MSRVLVLGGTGRTGRLIALAAAADGHEVTVASRHPERFESSSGPVAQGIRAARVDATDRAAVAEAVDGQDAVVLSVSTPARHPGGLYSAAARALVSAARERTRVIAISSGGVRHDDPALPFWYRRLLIPLVLRDLYVDMADMEQIIRDGGQRWTIVRASYLRDRPSTGRFRVAEEATPAHGWQLNRTDLARFAVDQLASDEWLERIPTLAQ